MSHASGKRGAEGQYWSHEEKRNGGLCNSEAAGGRVSESITETCSEALVGVRQRVHCTGFMGCAQTDQTEAFVLGIDRD